MDLVITLLLLVTHLCTQVFVTVVKPTSPTTWVAFSNGCLIAVFMRICVHTFYAIQELLS